MFYAFLMMLHIASFTVFGGSLVVTALLATFFSQTQITVRTFADVMRQILQKSTLPAFIVVILTGLGVSFWIGFDHFYTRNKYMYPKIAAVLVAGWCVFDILQKNKALIVDQTTATQEATAQSLDLTTFCAVARRNSWIGAFSILLAIFLIVFKPI